MTNLSETKHCGTCAHRTHKFDNWWQEKHIDGCSFICLITLNDISRFGECDCNSHSGLTTDGYNKRKEYIKPITNNIK